MHHHAPPSSTQSLHGPLAFWLQRYSSMVVCSPPLFWPHCTLHWTLSCGDINSENLACGYLSSACRKVEVLKTSSNHGWCLAHIQRFWQWHTGIEAVHFVLVFYVQVTGALYVFFLLLGYIHTGVELIHVFQQPNVTFVYESLEEGSGKLLNGCGKGDLWCTSNFTGMECLAKGLLAINQGSGACQLTVNQSLGSSSL